MKICFIDGSPKTKGSASGYFIDELCTIISEEMEKTILNSSKYKGVEQSSEFLKEAAHCDRLVIAFPLYVDAVPAHLLRILEDLEEYLKGTGSGPLVYGIINCGFYETSQNQHAFGVIKHFCRHAGLKWGFGLSIGGGGFLGNSPGIPIQAGPKKPLYKGLCVFAEVISSEAGDAGEDLYIKPGIPRILYHAAGNYGWKLQGKGNGLKVKDLSVLK